MYHQIFGSQDINEENNIFLKDSDLNNISLFIPNMGVFDEEDEDNYSINFQYYNEKIDSHIYEESKIEEKKQIQKRNNNNENLFSINERFSLDESQENDFVGKKHNINEDKITFKKNRNNLNNNYFKILKDIPENINNNNTKETSLSYNNNKITCLNKRVDSILIHFKSFLGKTFINHINNKLANITKRRIKFFSFNYKKFTLNVTYNINKLWLNEKIKDLLVLGDELNQIKNSKSLKSLYNKKEPIFNEIKALLELSYKELIERFYSSKYFEDFKNNEKIIQLNKNFMKIKKISILEKNGFINFINKEKGNNKKSDLD